MPRICSKCAKRLEDEPAILINGLSYCFLHSKQVYANAVAQRDESVEQLEAEYDKKNIAFCEAKQKHEFQVKDRERQRELYIRSGTLRDTKGYLWFAVSGFLFLWKPAAGILSAITLPFILIAIEEGLEKKRVNAFDKTHPLLPPFDLKSPKYPDNISLPFVRVGYDFSNDPIEFFDKGFDRLEILKRDDFTCQNCSKKLPAESLEVHHVNPRAHRGSDHKRNLISLCLDCHVKETWFGHFHMKTSPFKPNAKR